MEDPKLQHLLEWIKNTDDEYLQPSTHSYISPKITILNTDESGRGVFATSNIISKEQIIRIPHSFLLNFTTVIAHITKHNSSIALDSALYNRVYVPKKDIGMADEFTKIYEVLDLNDLLSLTSFQILSLYLTFESQRISSFWKPFIDMLPDLSDFILVPLIWEILHKDDDLINELPTSTKTHALKMISKFEEDYRVVRNLLLDKAGSFMTIQHLETLLPKERFLWSWMCINSRCLYMEMPQGKTIDDNFTMAPYVDFINHSVDEQCVLKIDQTGFQVLTSSINYKIKDQLYLSYGAHSNEFLICEYGFSLSQNKWDDLNISNNIIKLLNTDQIEFLIEMDYYDEYTITESGYSFRTEVALATLQEPYPSDKSRRLMGLINGITDGSVYLIKTQAVLIRLLNGIIKDCEKYLKYGGDDLDRKREMIRGLYRQRKVLAEKCIQNLI